MSLKLLLLMNAVGGPSRILFGLLADLWLGPLPTITPLAFCTSVLYYSWAGIDSLSRLFAFCAIFGFLSSAVAGLFPPACASLTTDLKSIGARTGMCFAVVSFATLTGPPIGGALVQIHDGEYLYAQIFGGTSLLAGGLFLVAARFASAREKK